MKRYLTKNAKYGISKCLFSSVQSLGHVWLFVIPWTEACQTSLCITNSWSLLKLMSIKLVMLPKHPSSVVCFSSCLQSSPASGSFSMSQFFTSGSQIIGAPASASFLPINISGLISFRIYWIDLAVQGTLKSLLLREVQKHQFFGNQLSL